MSYSSCVRGGGMCTGCMDCYDSYDDYEEELEEEYEYCADCSKELDPEDTYDVDGDKLCRDCLCARFKIPA